GAVATGTPPWFLVENGATAIADNAPLVGAKTTIQIVPGADLAVTKSMSPGTVTVGTPITVTLDVANNGPDIATAPTISDPFVSPDPKRVTAIPPACLTSAVSTFFG